VLFLHGPGGVGKTALVLRMAELAEEAGVPVARVDLRAIERSPAGLLAALAAALGEPDGAAARERLAGAGRTVLILDTYELAAPLDAWLREELLPSLGARALVVLAGRDRPAPGWRVDGGWSDLVRVVALRNLAPDDARRLLSLRRVPGALHDRLVEITHGHPLALALLGDVLAQRGVAWRHPELTDAPAIVALLLERFVAGVPSARHREALEVCAHARVTTEDLLRDALGGDDAGALFAWLRTLSFIEESPEGVFPHDLARDVLDADLRWRDRASYRDLHLRVRRHIVAALRTLGGPERHRAELDLLYLHRANPTVRAFWDWGTLGEARTDELRPGDAEAIVAMVERHEGPDSAAIARRWLSRQPAAFVPFRSGRDPTPIGFVALIALHEAAPDDLAADPGALAMWDHALRHGAPRPGEEVVAGRFLIDAEAYQAPSRTLNAVTAHSTATWLRRVRPAWEFIGCWADPDAIAPLMRHIDFARVPTADYEVGGRRYGVFAHDWRRTGVDAWLDALADREIATGQDAGPAPQPPAPTMALSQAEFTAAVRRALRDLHRPDALAANPLVRSAVVRERDPDAPPAEVLEALLREAVAALGADPRDERLQRVLDRTYVRPAPTQERAAELLGLPPSTYRRHLSRAVGRVADWLWQRELYGLRS
jgi:hypothetical protein